VRATTVTYERVHNLGNFENERVGIEIQLDEGEKADEALRLARVFVNRGLRPVLDETDDTELEIIASQLDAEGA
jgi:hypothetical protein